MDLINHHTKILFLILIPLLLSCQNAIEKAGRNAGYSAYEMIGVQKRDLLKKRVDTARDDEKEAGKEFKTALERLKEVSGFNGGELEKKYDSLKSSYDRASAKADTVHNSVQRVETVAKDLFEEWDKEIEQIETESLRVKSRDSLRQTEERYRQMHSNLKKAESKMDPVLHKFKDQVLFLKHNLNAQAVASLKGESLNIQREIEGLIQEMNKSIESADQFIKQMP